MVTPGRQRPGVIRQDPEKMRSSSPAQEMRVESQRDATDRLIWKFADLFENDIDTSQRDV